MFNRSPSTWRTMSSGPTPCVGILVVRAAGGVHMVIAGVPVARGRIDPAFEPDGKLVGLSRADGDLARASQIVRAAGPLDRVLAVGQHDPFAVGPIHLRLEGKVRRKALRHGWINPARAVAHDQTRDRRASALVFDAHADAPGGRGGEHDGNVRCGTRGRPCPVRRRISAPPRAGPRRGCRPRGSGIRPARPTALRQAAPCRRRRCRPTAPRCRAA